MFLCFLILNASLHFFLCIRWFCYAFVWWPCVVGILGGSEAQSLLLPKLGAPGMSMCGLCEPSCCNFSLGPSVGGVASPAAYEYCSPLRSIMYQLLCGGLTPRSWILPNRVWCVFVCWANRVCFDVVWTTGCVGSDTTNGLVLGSLGVTQCW